jgi:hypothetical protein
MLDWSSLFVLPSDPLKDSFLLYKRVTEQYENLEILKKVRSLIPQDIILKTTIKEDSNRNSVPYLQIHDNAIHLVEYKQYLQSYQGKLFC